MDLESKRNFLHTGAIFDWGGMEHRLDIYKTTTIDGV